MLLALKVAAVRAEALLSPDLHQSAIIVQRSNVQRSLLKKALTDTRGRDARTHMCRSLCSDTLFCSCTYVEFSERNSSGTLPFFFIPSRFLGGTVTKSTLYIRYILYTLHTFQIILPRRGMTEPAIKRIQEELEAMLNDPPPCCTLLPMGDDIFRLYLGLLNIAIAKVLRLGMSVSYCV